MVNLLTERKINSGQSLVEALDKAGFEITAAYWFRDEESGAWKLGLSEKHLASAREFYRRVNKVLGELSDSDLTLDEIVAVIPRSPILRLLSTVFRTGKHICQIQSSNNAVNGVLLPDMLIYRIA